MSAQVHIGLGFSHYYLIAGYLTGANSGFSLLFIKSDAMCPGKMVEASKADIMAVIGVAPPRIT